MRNNKKIDQSLKNALVSNVGFNLIEAAIVLGIVGLVIGGVWVAASSAYSSLRVKTASEQILAIGQNVRSTYASATRDAAALTTGQAITAGLIPSNMLATATTARTPWGGG